MRKGRFIASLALFALAIWNVVIGVGGFDWLFVTLFTTAGAVLLWSAFRKQTIKPKEQI